MSELLLVCVPGGHLDAAGGLLRIVLVPRLTGPGTTLRDYGLDRWPDAIRGAQFEIRLRSGPASAPQSLAATCQTDVQAEVWSGFFSPDFAVKPYAGQKTYADPLVDPTTSHAEQIETSYRTAAVAVADPGVVRDQYRQLDLADPRPPLPQDMPQTAFVPPDFHRALAMLREHPRVLRALGMIVDLIVPAGALTAAGAAGQISAAWAQAPAGAGTVLSPWTAYETTAGHFLPQSTRLIAAGLVDLRTSAPVRRTGADGTVSTQDQPDWVVTMVDVDAAVARLSDAKASTGTGAADPPATLPALRTVGLMLMHRGHGEWTATRAGRGRGNAAGTSVADGPPLTAEDLILGYRLDVKPGGDVWYSLTRRLASYTVGGQPVGDGKQVEEGHTKPAAVVLRPDQLITGSEAVIRWDGWSLAVPRPPLMRAGAPPHQQLAMPYDFAWTSELDPSGPAIPELRFGSSYQLRVRVVDLAGGGLALDEPAGDTTATDLVTYGRLEPVSAPVVPPPDGLVTPEPGGSVDHALLGPGGSVDVLVIRSDPQGTPADFAVTYPPNDQRTVLPPPMSFTVADQHGALDGADEATWANAKRALTPPVPAAAGDPGGPGYSWLPDRACQGVSLAPLWPEGAAAAVPEQRDWNIDHWPDYDVKHLTLVPATDNLVLADWMTATQARIALPAGRQVNLEISSTMPSDYLGRFAAGLWITGHADAATAAIAGRHPILTPSHTVLLVHAVRRPINAPQGALAGTRNAGDTFAVLADPDQPLLGVDRDSTAQLDVSAAWQEWADTAEPAPMSEVVQVVPVGRLDAKLPPIRHEFGDTRHRAITYTLTARSRFRQYFDPAEPEEAFAVSSTAAVTHIPSSARPAPPVILSAVPAFSWEASDAGGVITRVRHGGRLRVELARPWYTTGQGESLAVIAAPDVTRGLVGLVLAGTADWDVVSAAYRDPLPVTQALRAQPTASSFTEAQGPPAVVRDIESGGDVAVVAYPVWYAAGRRFADIVIRDLADQSYTPMIALSLARYQPFSLANLALSRLVRTDYLPLLPTRVLTVNRQEAGAVVVELAGLGPAATPNRVDIRLESRAGPGPAAAEDVAGELTVLNVPDSVPGWQSVSVTQATLNVASAPITLPDPSLTYRLVVREIENLAPSSAGPAGPLATDDPLVQQLSSRTVFADVVSLQVRSG
jgi:hypothetical protein